MEFNGKTMTAYGEFSGGGGISEEEFTELFDQNLDRTMEQITANVIAALPVYNGEVV